MGGVATCPEGVWESAPVPALGKEKCSASCSGRELFSCVDDEPSPACHVWRRYLRPGIP